MIGRPAACPIPCLGAVAVTPGGVVRTSGARPLLSGFVIAL